MELVNTKRFDQLIEDYRNMEIALKKIALERETDHIGDVWYTRAATLADSTLRNLDDDVNAFVWSKYSHDQPDTKVS